MEECNTCTIEKCDIFDFMAKYVGLSVLHPGGFRATLKLANECEVNKDTSVVDIACGKGTTSVLLAEEYGCKVTGIDMSHDLIDYATELARKKGLDSRVNFRVGDAMDLPFNDGEFDFAISQAILVLVPDKKRAIKEAYRVIKPGGRAGWIELSWKEDPPEDFMRKVSNELCAYCMTNVSTYEGWERLFKESGIGNLELQRYSLDMGGMKTMLADEGIRSTLRIMFRYATRSKMRRRMKSLSQFFQDNPRYFGYGIYVARK